VSVADRPLLHELVAECPVILGYFFAVMRISPRIAAIVAKKMSPADLLYGQCTGQSPPSVIALGDSRSRSKRQSRLEEFGFRKRLRSA
jgi:hypothetical protein